MGPVVRPDLDLKCCVGLRNAIGTATSNAVSTQSVASQKAIGVVGSDWYVLTLVSSFEASTMPLRCERCAASCCLLSEIASRAQILEIRSLAFTKFRPGRIKEGPWQRKLNRRLQQGLARLQIRRSRTQKLDTQPPWHRHMLTIIPFIALHLASEAWRYGWSFDYLRVSRLVSGTRCI